MILQCCSLVILRTDLQVHSKPKHKGRRNVVQKQTAFAILISQSVANTEEKRKTSLIKPSKKVKRIHDEHYFFCNFVFLSWFVKISWSPTHSKGKRDDNGLLCVTR